MSNITFKVNYYSLGRELKQKMGSDQRLAVLVDEEVEKNFLKHKKSLLSRFRNHKITKELKNGPNASNISDTLGGRGNLFSFLGFFKNTDPIEELENLLININIKKTTRRGNNFYYRINLPTKSEIIKATKMTWGSGSSWAIGIEEGGFNGDAGLGHYIYRTYINKSKSKAAVQSKERYTKSKSEFSPKPYLTPILDNFRNKMNRMIDSY